MDYTKTKTFIGIKHVKDGHTYWIKEGWTYEEENPGLFPYDTKEQKKFVEELLESYSKNWKLKGITSVVFKTDKENKFIEKPEKFVINKVDDPQNEVSAKKPRKNAKIKTG